MALRSGPLSSTLILISLAFGLGCAKSVTGGHGVYSVGGGGASARGGGSISVGGGSGIGPQGTLDGGGGGALGQKPVEMWAKDISKLPEFITYVEPVLRNIGRIKPEFERIFRHIVKDRSWYFLNDSIQKLSGPRQGLPGVTFDQWAVQDAKQVWLSNAYKGGEEGGTILLHEILMNLKIMRFLSYNEYCYQFADDRNLCTTDAESNRVLIANYKATAEDHKEVRAMVEWLKANAATMTPEDFGNQMHANQFQSPFYSWKAPIFRKPRVLNATLAALTSRPAVRMWTAFDPSMQATQTCDVKFTQDNDNHLLAKIVIRDMTSGRELRRFQIRADYDRAKDLSATPSDESVITNISFTDGQPVKKSGDRRGYMTLSFDDERLYDFTVGEQRMENPDEGGKGNDEGPHGVSCFSLPFYLPPEYTRWQTMRQIDREFLERDRFGGQTVEQLYKKYTKTLLDAGLS